MLPGTIGLLLSLVELLCCSLMEQTPHELCQQYKHSVSSKVSPRHWAANGVQVTPDQATVTSVAQLPWALPASSPLSGVLAN